MGPGGNSSILSYWNINPPSAIKAPSVIVNQTGYVVVDWNATYTNWTGIYFEIYLSTYTLNYTGSYFTYYYLMMPELCNGTDPAVIANTKCSFPMRGLKNRKFKSGSNIYATVLACNL